MNEFENWFYNQGGVIRNDKHPRHLSERCWNFQQEKINTLLELNEKAQEELLILRDKNNVLKQALAIKG